MLDLMLCCNDGCGNLDQLLAVEIGDRDGSVFIALEGDVMDGEQIDFCGKCIVVNGKHRTFFDAHQTYVGNIMWDCVTVSPAHAAALANYLRTLRHWSCPEASSPLFEKWRSDEPFTAADFRPTEIPY